MGVVVVREMIVGVVAVLVLVPEKADEVPEKVVEEPEKAVEVPETVAAGADLQVAGVAVVAEMLVGVVQVAFFPQ